MATRCFAVPWSSRTNPAPHGPCGSPRLRPKTSSVAEAEVISPNDFAAADLRDISLVIWQAALPRRGSSQPLLDFVTVGGQVIFFPPAEADETEWLDHRWGSPARRLSDEGRQSIDQWRDDSGLLAHADAGDPLPINRMVVREYRPIQGPGQVLARLHSGHPFLLRVPTDHGGVYFCATLRKSLIRIWPATGSCCLL